MCYSEKQKMKIVTKTKMKRCDRGGGTDVLTVLWSLCPSSRGGGLPGRVGPREGHVPALPGHPGGVPQRAAHHRQLPPLQHRRQGTQR